jgi:hypothetical protein
MEMGYAVHMTPSLLAILLGRPTVFVQPSAAPPTPRDRLTLEWSHVASALADGELPVLDPLEQISVGNDGPELGLIRLCVHSARRSKQFHEPPAAIDSYDHSREDAALALMDKGVLPLQGEEVALAEDCCEIGFSRLLARVLPLINPGDMDPWLTREHSRSDRNPQSGLHALAWCGYTEIMALLLENGHASVDLRASDGSNAASDARHPQTIALLAAHGLDPDATDHTGRTMPEVWVDRAQKASTQAALRTAWSRAFPISTQATKFLLEAKRNLVSGIRCKAGSLIQKDMKTAGVKPGELVNGRSLPEWVALGCLDGPNSGARPSAKSPDVVWAGNDPTRIGASGISDGFLYGLAARSDMWANLSTWALANSFEAKLSLGEQLAAVRRVADLFADPDKELPNLVSHWLIDTKTKSSPSELAAFLVEPDASSPSYSPPLRHDWMSKYLNTMMIDSIMATGTIDDWISYPQPHLWLSTLLGLLHEKKWLHSPDPDHYDLPLLTKTNNAPWPGARWITRLLDENVTLSGLSPQEFEKELTILRQSWPSLAAHMETDYLARSTPLRGAPGRSSPRL